jgi:transcriptional regulator with XRE-family HTH domain
LTPVSGQGTQKFEWGILFMRLLSMQLERDLTAIKKRPSDVAPGELEGQKLLAKLNEFVADSSLSIPRIAELMGVSRNTLMTWMSGTVKPQKVKLLEIRSFLYYHRRAEFQNHSAALSGRAPGRTYLA